MRFTGLVLCGALAACATAATENQQTWQVTRQEDPITGVSRCVVTAPDRVGGTAYTRMSYLYPFVELNSDAGLLVGVSTGGKVRFSPGDIVWRVDQEPPRTFTVANTPTIGAQANVVTMDATSPEQQQAMETAMKMTAGITSSMQNGITAVGGADAEAALAEMKSGKSLLFRAASAAPSAGVPSSQTFKVGQVQRGKLKPFQLDESFESALAQCGL